MGSEQELVAAKKRAEIDTRAPFQSVKEAVRLFGEKVLVGEVYSSKLKQIHIGENQIEQDPASSSRIETVAAELEETKLSLQKAKEDTMLMAHCLSSLQEELEKTKRDLKQLKKTEAEKRLILSEIDEDVKIIDDSTQFQVKKQVVTNNNDEEINDNVVDLKKKRFVTFANPVSVAKVIIPPTVEALERHPSLRKKKKKPLIPLIGGMFSKNKPSHEVHHFP